MNTVYRRWTGVFAGVVGLAAGMVWAEDAGKVAATQGWFATQIDTNGQSSCRRQFAGGFFDEGSQRSFVCWPGPEYAPQVKAYDHKIAKWSETVKVAEGSPNYHNYCLLVRGGDGHLNLFWCHHGGASFHARSEKPLSVEGTWKVEKISNGGAYPMPAVANIGTMYFFRCGGRRHLVVDKSEDNGLSWKKMENELNPDTPDGWFEVYAGTLKHQPKGKNNAERFLIPWTISGKQGHNKHHKDLYLIAFHPEDGRWHAIDGTDLGTKVVFDDMRKHCLVVDTGDEINDGPEVKRHIVRHNHDTTYREDGGPVIAYRYRGDVWTGYWAGKEWQLSKLVEDADNRGFVRNGPDDFTLVLDYKEGVGRRLYRSKDGGATWAEAGIVKTEAPTYRGEAVLEPSHPSIRMILNQGSKNGYSGGNKVFVAGEAALGVKGD